MYSTIATYLKTRYESKKYGGYNIYEDDKIYISYDTYYPNIDVYVKIPDGKRYCVLNHSGHGYNQEYHSGEWEKYCKDILLPKALVKKEEHENQMKIKQQKEHEDRFSSCSKKLDDVYIK